MKPITKFLSFFFLTMAFSQNINADALVWKIENQNQKLYIGGTFHILTPKDYPLPSAFEEAYLQSGTLIFETDNDAIKTTRFKQLMLSRVTYKNDRNLKSDLSEQAFENLLNYLKSRNLGIEHVINFKPGMASTLITMLELQINGFVGMGVDEYFSTKAKNDHKQRSFFETPEEQVEFIVNMGKGYEDKLINYTLQDIKTMPKALSSMKKWWREGNISLLKQEVAIPFKSEFPNLYNSIIIQRNNKWIKKLEPLIDSKEVEFVLVGALHLVGDDGVIEVLKNKGYIVTRL